MSEIGASSGGYVDKTIKKTDPTAAGPVRAPGPNPAEAVKSTADSTISSVSSFLRTPEGKAIAAGIILMPVPLLGEALILGGAAFAAKNYLENQAAAPAKAPEKTSPAPDTVRAIRSAAEGAARIVADSLKQIPKEFLLNKSGQADTTEKIEKPEIKTEKADTIKVKTAKEAAKLAIEFSEGATKNTKIAFEALKTVDPQFPALVLEALELAGKAGKIATDNATHAKKAAEIAAKLAKDKAGTPEGENEAKAAKIAAEAANKAIKNAGLALEALKVTINEIQDAYKD